MRFIWLFWYIVGRKNGKTCFIPFYSIKVHDIYELGSIGNFTEMNNSDGIMEAIFEYWFDDVLLS